MIDIRELILEEGVSPYAKWFDALPPEIAARVSIAILRMSQGNLSNVKWFRGIGECRLDFGAGWRIYLAKDGERLILLLGGGSKRSQDRDIERALTFWQQYKRAKPNAQTRNV